MKLVRESLAQTFTRGSDDKLATMGSGRLLLQRRGMKKIKILSQTLLLSMMRIILSLKKSVQCIIK